MKQRKQILGLLGAAGMLALILDSRTALIGAGAGIELCLKTVVPSLFPFFVLSTLVIGSWGGDFRLPRCLSGLLPGMTDRMPALVLPAILGGYPVGAQAVCQAWRGGTLSKEEAQGLLAFSSNAGPAFLFGMVGKLFPEPWMVWLIWGIHLLGALFAARCISLPASQAGSVVPSKASCDPVRESVRTMAVVCGWIVLFRTLIAFLDRWVLFAVPPTVRVLVIGLLELSNGCLELRRISDVTVRFLVCGCLLAAGGLCVSVQTLSVTKGLSLRYYGLGKALQTLVSFLFGISLVLKTPAPLLALLPVYLLCKKRYGNQAAFVV